MIESLFQGYFQKSRGFLFPVLGVRRNSATQPLQTYISWENIIEPEDRKLVCLYDTGSAGFRSFEKIILFSNNLFESMYPTGSDRAAYVFNLNAYGKDWEQFLVGKYSRFSPQLKRAILKYHDSSPEKIWMDSWLNPENYFKEYARLLDVKKSLLIEVGELIDKPDLAKEKLIIVDKIDEVLQI